MRTLRKNKQTMYYSLYSTASEVYEQEGTSVKTIVDQETGETIPVEVGTLKPVYAPPVEFQANITSNLNKLHKDLEKELGRVYIRYSGTENKLRLLVEAETDTLCRVRMDQLKAAAKLDFEEHNHRGAE